MRTEDLDVEAGGGLSHLVDGLARIVPLILRHQVLDVQRNVAEVEGGVEARGRLQRLAVVEPLDTQIGIVDRLNASLDVSGATLGQLGRALQNSIPYRGQRSGQAETTPNQLVDPELD